MALIEYIGTDAAAYAATYQTNADGSPVPFVSRWRVDAPSQPVAVYEDATGALLGSGTSSASPEASGPHAGWYLANVPITSWSSSAGALLPVMAAAGAMSIPTLSAVRAIPSIACLGAMAEITYSAGSGFDLPTMAGRGAMLAPTFSAAASLPTMAGAGAMAAPTIEEGGGAAGLVPANPSFETDITATTEQTGAWWKSFVSSEAGRYASATMTGSYVGRLYGLGYYDGEGDVGDTAKLFYKFLPADFADGKESITFDVRRVSGVGTPQLNFRVDVRDSGNVALVSQAGGKNIALIAGDPDTNSDNTTLKIASPVNGTTYPGKTMNLKTWITDRLTAGKTWSDVAKVIISFEAPSAGESSPNEWYVDNFR